MGFGKDTANIRHFEHKGLELRKLKSTRDGDSMSALDLLEGIDGINDNETGRRCMKGAC